MLPTIITFSEGSIASIIGYVGELFIDISPLFFVIVGISIGLWIFGSIVRAIAKRHEED